MASLSRAILRASTPLTLNRRERRPKSIRQRRRSRTSLAVVRVIDGDDSYLGMRRKAAEKEKNEAEFEKLAQNFSMTDDDDSDSGDNGEKSDKFKKILEISKEERDQMRMEVIDRASTTILVPRSVIKSNSSPETEDSINENRKLISAQEDGRDYYFGYIFKLLRNLPPVILL